MRYFLAVLACVAVGTLSADYIGNVEYHMPNKGKGWKLVNNMEGKRNNPGKTLIYIPENTPRESAKEQFGVHQNSKPTDLTNTAGLEKGLQLNFPDLKINTTVLEKSTDSLLYEWTASEATGKEMFHGWTRVFSTPKSTILIAYQTGDLGKLDQAKSTWLPVLKQAKMHQ